MKTMYLGDVVRQQRKSLGLSQEMVCEGLCATMTLSRFESNQQTPSRDCVMAILQRLGLPDDRYYAQLTKKETKIDRLRKEARAYFSQFEQTVGDEQQQACTNALKKLRSLERCIKKEDHINQQFILGMRADLEAHSPRKQLEMLMDAIHRTSPRFDLDHLSSCLYCEDEVVIISRIAIVESRHGQRKKAIDIYRQLLTLVLKRTPNHSCLPLIAYNYTLYLALEKRWEEALKIAEFGREACLKQGHYHLFPGFLHIEADCYYWMGKLSKSAELYSSAYYIYGAIGDTNNQNVVKTVAEERLNLLL